LICHTLKFNTQALRLSAKVPEFCVSDYNSKKHQARPGRGTTLRYRPMM